MSMLFFVVSGLMTSMAWALAERWYGPKAGYLTFAIGLLVIGATMAITGIH